MFTTNNKIMLNNFENQKVVKCVQQTVEKKVLDSDIKTEQILMESNKLGFGDEIGQVTNRITSMFDVICKFELGTKEYDMLSYRIIASQKVAQDCIDRVKGVKCYIMPKYWYQKTNNIHSEEDIFNNSICANKKPYFMRYIYPDIDKKYKDVIKAMAQGLRRTSDSDEYKKYYEEKIPVNDNGCTMNRLCHMVENEFSKYRNALTKKEFDYSILKSDSKYSKDTYNKIHNLYKEYVSQKRLSSSESEKKRRSPEEYGNELELIKDTFVKRCYEVCSNSDMLCNIVVDICYKTKNSKAFAWEMCGEQIIKNLLDKKNNKVKYISRDNNGNIEYHGYMFSEKYIEDNIT